MYASEFDRHKGKKYSGDDVAECKTITKIRLTAAIIYSIAYNVRNTNK